MNLTDFEWKIPDSNERIKLPLCLRCTRPLGSALVAVNKLDDPGVGQNGTDDVAFL
jgi:hypothetical protein